MDEDVLTRLSQRMGKSPKIRKVFRDIGRIATKKDIPILISGESGTYKELVAKAIHVSSPRSDSAFIGVNLSSTPKELIESELVGNERSTSKGATEKRISKIEQANGGTLYLDEVMELDKDLQGKLLHLIQNNEIYPLGINNALKVDVRIICATSRDLQQAMKNRQFREDLQPPFKASHIKIPSLRERRDDILPLAQYFLEETVRKFDTNPKEFSKDAKNYLIRYEWPGNMRELENIIKRATILSNEHIIRKKDLMFENIGSLSMKEFLEEKLKRYLKEMTKLEKCNLYDTVLSEAEKALISIVLQETGSNQLKTAKTLGINRNTLRSKIKEYKIRL